MLPADDIARQRLNNQLLLGERKNTIAETVRHMGALQAQDATMSKWAIGIRLPGITEEAVNQAFDQNEIVRTHILRPTWHLVAAPDLRWMLRLSRPQIKTALRALDQQMGIDDAMINQSQLLMGKALEGGREYSRGQLMQVLSDAGMHANSAVAIHLMMHAELDALVCSGSLSAKETTYVLLSERIPDELYPLRREESLCTLAFRYFSSHGPATLADFQWWSGLNAPDARLALEGVKFMLKQEGNGKSALWYNPRNTTTQQERSFHLLPAFDEYTVSYKDRSAVLQPDFTRDVITVNGIFKPMLVDNGQVVGYWKRELRKDKVLLAMRLLKTNVGTDLHSATGSQLMNYSTFLQRDLILSHEQ